MILQDPRPATTHAAKVDSSFKALCASARPPNVSGAFRASIATGNIAAGTGAGVLWATRYSGPGTMVVRSLSVAVRTLTAFTQGNLQLDLFITRGFSRVDGGPGGTGIDGSPGEAKLYDILACTQVYEMNVANTGVLTAGIGNDDPQPISSLIFNMAAALGSDSNAQNFLMSDFSSTEVRLRYNEGLRIRNAAFPATGTAKLWFACEWAEIMPTVLP